MGSSAAGQKRLEVSGRGLRPAVGRSRLMTMMMVMMITATIPPFSFSTCSFHHSCGLTLIVSGLDPHLALCFKRYLASNRYNAFKSYHDEVKAYCEASGIKRTKAEATLCVVALLTERQEDH